MKTKPHAKLLAEAAGIVDCEFTDPTLTRHGLAYFESRCLDWLAEHIGRGFVLKVANASRCWCVQDRFTNYSFEKLRHVALAKAVLTVHKQETQR